MPSQRDGPRPVRTGGAAGQRGNWHLHSSLPRGPTIIERPLPTAAHKRRTLTSAGPLLQSGKEDFKTRGFTSFQSFPPQRAKPSQSRLMQAQTRRAQRRRAAPQSSQQKQRRTIQFKILPRRPNGTVPCAAGRRRDSLPPPPPQSRRQKQQGNARFKILPRRAKGAAPCAAGQRGDPHPHRRRTAARSASPYRPPSAACAPPQNRGAQRLAPAIARKQARPPPPSKAPALPRV